MPIIITPQMWSLITLMIENAMATTFNQISKMSAEEISAGIATEEAKKVSIMAEINSH
jgi:hypothetical protein